MDWIKFPFTARYKLHDSPDAPWVDVLWTPTDLPFLELETLVNCRIWQSDDVTDFDVGQEWPIERGYSNVWGITGLTGEHHCGEDSDFEDGQPWPYDGPPIEYDADHIPLCCPRDRFEDVTAGSSADLGVDHGYAIAPTAGAAVDYILPEPFPPTVTAGSSADVGAEFVRVTAGGAVDYILGGHGEAVYDVAGDHTFIAVVSGAHDIEGIGGGGGGGGATYGGTGGAAYAKKRAVILTSGTTYNLHVAAGGPSGLSSDGEPTWFEAPAFVRAMLAAGGHYPPGIGAGGQGGQAGDCIGDVTRNGGDGANQFDDFGGGGGGAAGPDADGLPGHADVGGAGNGGTASVAGDGANGAAPGDSGADGFDSGGGGGGGGAGMTTTGGGGRGWLRIVW